jgi:hypothetical protein
MLHAGLDLSRKRVDVCLLNEDGEHVDQLAAPPDADAEDPRQAHRRGLSGAGLRRDRVDDRCPARPRHAEQEGWDVEIADAQEGEGPGAAGVQGRQDRLALAGGLEPPRPGAGDLAARPPSTSASPRDRGQPLAGAGEVATGAARGSAVRSADGALVGALGADAGPPLPDPCAVTARPLAEPPLLGVACRKRVA